MKISYFGVRKVGFDSRDGTFVAEAIFQTKGDERLTGVHRIRSHEILMTVRVRGDRSWPFVRVEEEIRAEASSILAIAKSHIDGKGIDFLEEYNDIIDQENEAELSRPV